jgi:hypothetical protein
MIMMGLDEEGKLLELVLALDLEVLQIHGRLDHVLNFLEQKLALELVEVILT